MASLANISSLDVAYYTGRVKIFPFQNHFLLDKSFSTFTLTTGVFVTALQASSPVDVVQQQGRLGIHKEEERAFKVFSPHTLLVFKVSHTACQGEDKGNEED